MAKSRISTKHLQINKANTVITVALAAASFVTVAALVGSRAMLSQRSFQARVIQDKELAVKTLRDNIDAVETLQTSYKEFISRPSNIIGGNTAGGGERDGDNAKIVLDALPSKYDFPALATSLEKVLTQNNFQITEISGTDDEVAQASRENPVPEVVEMPFSFTIVGSYDAMSDLIKNLELSIRPIQITKLNFRADTDGLELEVTAKSYYQSEKKFNVTTKVVK